MKKLIIGLVAVAALAAAGYFGWRAWRGGGDPADGGDTAARARRIGAADPAKAGTAAGTDEAPDRNKKGKKRRIVERVSNAQFIQDRDDLSPEEKDLMLAIDTALDEEDLDALIALLPKVSASTNAEIRSDLVDALGWFGKKAMLDLMPFMADPDEDVRQSAIDSWNMALGDIGNGHRKCSYIESAMTVLTDEDALDTMITELMDCDERLAIQTIVNIISSGTTAAVAAAKEQYEFITGDEYTTIEAAEEWLRENYVDENGETQADREEAAAEADGSDAEADGSGEAAPAPAP